MKTPALVYGKGPRGFREPPRRVSDPRPGDYDHARHLLCDGVQLDVAVAHKRKTSPPSRYFVLYQRTGCMTKKRVAAVSPEQLRKLAAEFGYCRAWDAPVEPLVVSRSVWERSSQWRPDAG